MSHSPKNTQPGESPSSNDTVAELLRDVGPWEGETYEELVKLFSDVRQRSQRSVPSLDE